MIAALTIPLWVAVTLWAIVGACAVASEVRWHREFSRSRRTVRRIREWSE